ncbi:Metallo-dependent phosphatase [Micractinium conductrix]|uniref:Metallo-dependent phosphatase n=1 Tax=Micractinium conductrix TaxID=554055 RepID=A0A2P6VC68_9CHLO|nr:Metallo-dependent phosphatase [Micractinium conductrix]|eukprot:PSC71678.1 Metallo-dependent phosphatase [Micractinium conductrix]
MASGGGGTLLPAWSARSDAHNTDVPLSSAAPPPVSPRGFEVAGAAPPSQRPSQRRRLACFIALGVVIVALLVAVAVAGAESYARGGWNTASTTYPLRFQVIGDWGRQGAGNQSLVAELMGSVADLRPPHFVISTGDNFYKSGLTGTDDPLFDASFSRVYTQEGLQVPWHAVLGNHDYCDSSVNGTVNGTAVSPLHQLNIELTNQDQRWHLERAYVESFVGGRVQIFFIDTSPFITEYYTKFVEKGYNCSGGLAEQSWQAQLLELERKLHRSAAEWKLVVGHHPPLSSGEHGNNKELLQHLQPLLQKYGVQAYFAGHDHDMECLAAEGYHIVVSGAGSETNRTQGTPNPGSTFYWPYSGFVAVRLEADSMRVDFHTLDGGTQPAFTSTIPRRGTQA